MRIIGGGTLYADIIGFSLFRILMQMLTHTVSLNKSIYKRHFFSQYIFNKHAKHKEEILKFLH